MRIDIVSCVPALLESFFAFSIIERAKAKNIAHIYVHDLRQWAENKHGQIDDYAYGGGAGMVMMAGPLSRCIRELKGKYGHKNVVYMSPDGDLLDQSLANRFSMLESMIIVCGHYKGIDERIRTLYITHEVSIGDYVLSGGELAAAVLSDAIIRLLPGVLSDETSALTDSFQDGLLAPPLYTRPEQFEGLQVPQILLSGNHDAIDKWRYEQSLERTESRRPVLFQKLQDRNM